MAADDDDVQAEDLDVHKITCALQIVRGRTIAIMMVAATVVMIMAILVMPSMRAHTPQSRTHAQSVRFESHTKHFAPLCKRNPGGFEWPVEEVVDERPTAWAGWERQGRCSTTTVDQERYGEYRY
jgi:hypothetical protein